MKFLDLGREHVVRGFASVTTSTEGQPSAWTHIVLGRLQSIAALEDGWDGRSAPRVSEANMKIAMELLQRVMQTGTPLPELVPTLHGGLQIEWHVRHVDVELEIVSPALFILSFEDRAADREIETQLSADLGPFVEAVKRISSGQ